MTPALLLSTLLVLSASPARPRPSAPRLSVAQSEFNRGDFLAALKTLDAVEAENPDDATVAKAELLKGQCHGALRDFARAEEDFARALDHDPESRLDPARVDPDLVKVLEDLRDRLRGELVVRVDGPARVTVDGKPLAGTPARGSVGIGRHAVEARSHDGTRGASRSVVIRPNRPTEVELALAELPRPPPVETPRPAPAAPAAPAPGTTNPMAIDPSRPFADVRAGVDPLQFGDGVAFEVGGGLEGQYLRLSLHARVLPSFGLIPRGALSVPVSDHARAYISVELPLLFLDRIAFGLGGGLGAEYVISPWLAGFAELGGRHFFLAPDNYDPTRLTVQAGVRLRIP